MNLPDLVMLFVALVMGLAVGEAVFAAAVFFINRKSHD